MADPILTPIGNLPVADTIGNADQIVIQQSGKAKRAAATLFVGKNGEPGVSPTFQISKDDGVTTIVITDALGSHTIILNDGAEGPAGEDGQDGADGRGIVSVEKTSTAGLVDTYTITYTDNTTSTFSIKNGSGSSSGGEGAGSSINPVDQSIDMTQPVGVDGNGQLWTNPYVLPVATAGTLGGVQPVSKGAAMTQEVGVDSVGRLFTSVGKSYWNGTQAQYDAIPHNADMLYIITEDSV